MNPLSILLCLHQNRSIRSTWFNCCRRPRGRRAGAYPAL